MRIRLDAASDTPIYQQMVDQIAQDIQSGKLAPGAQLPTVRHMADKSGMSRGTVKQAYDTLEHMGLVEKTQGRGTFVRSFVQQAGKSKKEAAMQNIDVLLDDLQELGLPMRDIRIFLDLKLREREHAVRSVRLGIVDCSPEALSVIHDQVSSLSHVDAYEYLLQKVMEAPHRFNPGLDLFVTTSTHVDQLREKMPPDLRLTPVVMSVSPSTILELARIPQTARVGILCASERFAGIILRACDKYCILDTPPQIDYFGDAARLVGFVNHIDTLILPANYQKLAGAEDLAALEPYLQSHSSIIYHYELDRGSLLSLEQQITGLYEHNKSKA